MERLKKNVGMTVIENFVIDTRNDRGDMLVGLKERRNQKNMNTFFYHKTSKK